jgi:inner membrane protein
VSFTLYHKVNMNDYPPPPPLPSLPALLKRWATSFKIAGVALLILLLLIPLQMVRSVLQERLGRRNEAVENITTTWGREQKIIGPVLIVPYRYPMRSWKEQPGPGGKMERVESMEMVRANAYFLPAHLAISGKVTPARLRRGIYEAVVYTGRFRLSGQFTRPDFGSLKIEEKNVLWEEAAITLAIPDLRGVNETLALEWDGSRHPLLPGSKLKGFQSGVFTSIGRLRDAGPNLPFGVDLTLNGSGALSFAPVAVQSAVKLTSDWPDPSFFGGVLPTERRVTREGFEAAWQVSYYARDYAQQWTDQDITGALTSGAAEASLFGVRFLSGIDAYRTTERAIKYGALFMVLMFAAFFLFEVLAGLRIHPFQYAIIGAALCLFYLGLLSLSEFVPFGLSYLAAASATTLLICFHSARMLRSGARTTIVAGLLVGIYTYLYVALQLQDYALLLGTAALFGALTAVVVVTRKIDWYAWDRSPTLEQS